MYKVKKYIIAVGVMLMVSAVCLLVVSIFTYWLKWNSDRAMIGIMVTYVLSGFLGGVVLNRLERREYKPRKEAEVVVLSILYVLVLIIGSFLCVQVSFEFTGKCILIWLLIMCSMYVGVCK